MICSIHQPNYIPYLGLFHKLAQSDIFVFYDIAQYTKGDYHNRNSIKGPNGAILLSLPAQVTLGQMIKDVHFDARILSKHKKTIEESYKKAPFFAEIFPLIEKIYSYTGDNICDFNIETISLLAHTLVDNVELIRLSDVMPELHKKSTEALIEICKSVGASTYISGSGGRTYLETSLFLDAGISLEFQDFHHPEYSQLWGPFLPNLSMVDYLFNVGIGEAKNYLCSVKKSTNII